MNSPFGAQQLTKRDLPAALLPVLKESLAQHGSFRLPLRGNSMQPTLPTECEIEIAPVKGELPLGDLIVFLVGDGLVAHRLVRRSGEFLVAQGDNRRAADLPLKPEQVLGRVIAATVEARKIWPGPFERALAPAWVARHYALQTARSVLRRGRK